MGSLNRHFLSHAAMIAAAGLYGGIDRQPFNGNQQPPQFKYDGRPTKNGFETKRKQNKRKGYK